MGNFTLEDLNFFKEWALKPYDPINKAHIIEKETLMNTVWKKTHLLVKEIVKKNPTLSIKGGEFWSQRGLTDSDDTKKQVAIFKPYTWYKVHRKTDEGKDIFFTFGIDAHPLTLSFV